MLLGEWLRPPATLTPVPHTTYSLLPSSYLKDKLSRFVPAGTSNPLKLQLFGLYNGKNHENGFIEL